MNGPLLRQPTRWRLRRVRQVLELDQLAAARYEAAPALMRGQTYRGSGRLRNGVLQVLARGTINLGFVA